MQKKSELFFNLILLPIDFLAVLSAFILAYVIRLHPEVLGIEAVAKPTAYVLGIEFFLKIALLIIPFWILIFALTGLYSLSSLRGRLEEMGKIFVAVSGGVMMMILVDFASTTPVFPAKAIPIIGYGLSLVFVALGRQVVRGLQRYLFGYGVGVHQAVIVGSGDIAQRLVYDLGQTRRSGFRFIAALDPAKGASRRLPGLDVYPSLDKLLANVSRRQIDEFIQADSALEPEEVMHLIQYAASRHITYRFVPNQLGLFASQSNVSVMAGMPVVEIRQTPLEGWGRIVKRAFDIAGSVLGLVFFLLLGLLIALAIRATDPGPIFYRQRRLSRFGQPIQIYKFRTMKREFSTGPDFGGRTNDQAFKALGQPELAREFAKENKLPRDPRVSTVGRFLRRTSLDELPQLWNVLLGDLSLVGPRPMLEDELDRYGEKLPTVLALRCGVTGLWQVSGRTDIGFEGRVKMDLFYVENWSLWLDIRIIAKTVLMLLSRRNGAY